jgi:Protein of unknown function (DUF2946)
MIRKRADTSGRAFGLAAALFAITLNFLQPVVHAALLRDGSPSTLWTMFCDATAADSDQAAGSLPTGKAVAHDCCLGLAHVQALIEPSADSLPLSFAERCASPLPDAAEGLPAASIRDGPHRPRGPPILI